MELSTHIFWAILMLFILALFCFKCDANEHMTNKIKNHLKQQIPIEKVQTGSKNAYLDDPVFSDVIIYENDDVQEFTDDVGNQSGIYKCLHMRDRGVCRSCVEDGITGKATCFKQ